MPDAVDPFALAARLARERAKLRPIEGAEWGEAGTTGWACLLDGLGRTVFTFPAGAYLLGVQKREFAYSYDDPVARRTTAITAKVVLGSDGLTASVEETARVSVTLPTTHKLTSVPAANVFREQFVFPSFANDPRVTGCTFCVWRPSLGLLQCTPLLWFRHGNEYDLAYQQVTRVSWVPERRAFVAEGVRLSRFWTDEVGNLLQKPTDPA